MAELLTALSVAGMPMAGPVCEAAVIAQYRMVMSESQWREVIDVAEQVGQIGPDHAIDLRRLIFEAYRAEDLVGWVRNHCEN